MAEEKKDIFEKLFEADQVAKESQMAPALKGVTGVADNVKVEKKNPDSKTRILPNKPGSIVLQASVFLAVLTFGFFTFQNNPKIHLFSYENPALELQFSTERVAELEAEVMVQKHLAAVLLLENIAMLGNEYLYSLSQSEATYLSDSKKDDFAEEAATQQENLVLLISQVQELLNEKPSPEQMEAGREVIVNLIEESSQLSEEDSLAQVQEILDLEAARILLIQMEFRNQILGLSTEEIGEEEIISILQSYASISQSPAARVTQVKQEQILWSLVWDELEDRIRSLDPLFGSELTGTLEVSEVKMSATDREISLTGNSLTSDTKNFTVVSNLIDEIEDSEYFYGVASRVFTKNESEEDSFSGTFRIELYLEENYE